MVLNLIYNIIFYNQNTIEQQKEWKNVFFCEYNIDFIYKLPYIIPSDEIAVAIRNIIDVNIEITNIIKNIEIITEYIITIHFLDNTTLTIDYRNYLFEPIYVYKERIMEYSKIVNKECLFRILNFKLKNNYDYFVEV